MEHVSLDEVEDRMGPAAVKRKLAPALDVVDVALNYYELEPGDGFGFGYHRHSDQEEVFYVQQGTVTFETEDGEHEVGAGECVRFAPGEWQRGSNEGDERVVALAVGAPPDMGETTMLRECPDCAGRTEQRLETTDDRDAILTLCAECGARTGRFD